MENSRRFLLLRTDILQKQSLGDLDYWMRVSMMWRSLQIDEDFRWITASEICIILHIIWKPLLILGWRNLQMSDYHCRADTVVLNVTTPSVAPSSQGTGYSGFQVTGMLECGQNADKNQPSPPPKKKSKGCLTKPKKFPAQKLTPPPPPPLPRETLYPGTGTVPEF